MRTAKDIIGEFRARGYGMESLRVLADSRDEPMRSEMLALLSQEAGGEAASDNMAFFVVSDEDRIEDVDADIIDFDIMASNLLPALDLPPAAKDDPPALASESVAEITVGENADFVLFDRDGRETALQPCLEAPLGSGPEAAVLAAEVKAAWDTPLPVVSESGAVVGESDENIAKFDAEDDPLAYGLHLSFVGEAEHSDDYLPGSVSESLDESRAKQVDDLGFAEFAEQALSESQKTLPESESPVAVFESVTSNDVPESAKQKHESKAERRRRRRAERKLAKEVKRARMAAKAEAMSSDLEVLDDVSFAASPEEAEAGTSKDLAGEAACSGENGSEDIVPANTPDDHAAADVSFSADREEVEAGTSKDFIEEAACSDENGEEGFVQANTPDDQADDDVSFSADREEAEAGTSKDFIEEAACSDENGEEGFVQTNTPDDQADEGNVIHLFNVPGNNRWVRDDGNADSFVGTLCFLENDAESVSDNTVKTGEGETGGKETLPPLARLGLLRALTGWEAASCEAEYGCEGDIDPGEHVIVQPEPETKATGQDNAALEEMEKEYQSRLDDFAKRLLDLQIAVAAGDVKIREQAEELSARNMAIADAESRISSGEKSIHSLTADLARLTDELAEKKQSIERFTGLQEEHRRLYREFEDIRKSYNEIVVDAMPTLQKERDDLVLVVERQGEDEEKLRSAFKTSGRRITVGYSLAAAAALMMVALPLTHWMRAGDADRRLAIGHQQASEIRERMNKAELKNVKADEEIFNLKREIALAKLDQDKRTHELTLLKAELAVGGGSGKTVSAAGGNQTLHGPNQQGKPIRINEIRDPSGSINKALAENRERYAYEDAQLAKAPKPQSRSGAVALSSIATVKPASAGVRRDSGVVAVVKAGEGVAQVVYRVLGTRDPEVVAWVIRENNIKKDKRGNPQIYPDQKLLLPSDNAETAKSASAATR